MSAKLRLALGAALLVLGALAIILGVVGLGGDDEESAHDPIPTTSAAPIPSTTPPTTAVPTTTTAPTPTEPPEPAPTTTTAADVASDVTEFFDGFAAAVSNGDAAGLLATLHPAVTDRYGVDQCTSYLDGVAGQPLTISAAEATAGPEPGVYETDELSTEIDDLVLVDVTRAELGGDERTDPTRVAYLEGQLRWFSDCGEPIES